MLPAWWPSVATVVVALLLWQAGSAGEWWSPQVLPSPREVWDAAIREASDGPLLEDMTATLGSFVAAWIGGTLFGGLAGYLFWRRPLVGRAFEPYLVSFYTVPLVVFYPMLIVIIGINSWPIIILGSIMAGIPMALNTWVGLGSVRKVYLDLGRSLGASKATTLRQIALPAAAPLVIAGATMAAVYSLIGVVAMEFMIAQQGMGYRIRYRYESFDNSGMYFYIVITLLVSLVVLWIVSFLPRLIGMRRMTR